MDRDKDVVGRNGAKEILIPGHHLDDMRGTGCKESSNAPASQFLLHDLFHCRQSSRVNVRKHGAVNDDMMNG